MALAKRGRISTGVGEPIPSLDFDLDLDMDLDREDQAINSIPL